MQQKLQIAHGKSTAMQGGAGRGILQTHEAKIRIAMQIHSHTHTPIHTGAHKEVARQRQIHAKHFVAAYLVNFVLDF